jgi:hypothetical protein
MEQVDKVRRIFLREAEKVEEEALALEDEREQDELLDLTVPLLVLANLRNYRASSHQGPVLPVGGFPRGRGYGKV